MKNAREKKTKTEKERLKKREKNTWNKTHGKGRKTNEKRERKRV